MWDKYRIAGQATDDNIIRRMRAACRTTKTTDTRSDYVTLTALPRRLWLRERGCMLRFAYFACLVTSWNLTPSNPKILTGFYVLTTFQPHD